MSLPSTSSRLSPNRFARERDMDRAAHTKSAAENEPSGQAAEDRVQPSSRSQSRLPALFDTVKRRWLIIVAFSIVALNGWLFHEELIKTAISILDKMFGASLLASTPSTLHTRSISSQCRSCDALTPTMKRHITDYVHFLLSQAGVGEAELSRVGPQRDYALRADGGSVICELTSGCFWWLAGFPALSSTAEHAIDDSHAIGHCWYLSAAFGQLGIMLVEPVYPTTITIDHIPQALAADIGQAPRRMLLWGLLDGEQNKARFRELSFQDIYVLEGRSGPPATTGHPFAPLAFLEYDISAPFHIQSFPVFNNVVEAGIDFTIVVLEILDNWGATATCLYRVRVHGERVASTGWKA